jgi:hypothetical protein
MASLGLPWFPVSTTDCKGNPTDFYHDTWGRLDSWLVVAELALYLRVDIDVVVGW